MKKFDLKFIVDEYIEKYMSEKEKNCNTKEYKNFIENGNGLFEKLLSELSDSAKKDLYAYQENLMQASLQAEAQMFEKGFSVGAKFIAEILCGKSIEE